MSETPSSPIPVATEPSAPPLPPAADESNGTARMVESGAVSSSPLPPAVDELPGKARAVELLAQEIAPADFISPDTAPVMLQDLSTIHVAPSSLDVRSNERLLADMLGREYDNFNQSSFHSDNLRNQIIQFYLILVGAAATAIVGIAQLQAGGTSAVPLANQVLWPFSAIAFFIGLIGIIMLPIFVRLRRVVLECLAGTVLIKRYVERNLGKTGDTLFGSAMLWDARSLPLDENYLTASFVLVFVVMLLSSVMVALGVFLHLYEGLLAQRAELYGAFAWSLFVGFAVLTVQVIAYACGWHTKSTNSRRMTNCAKNGLPSKLNPSLCVTPQSCAPSSKPYSFSVSPRSIFSITRQRGLPFPKCGGC